LSGIINPIYLLVKYLVERLFSCTEYWHTCCHYRRATAFYV